MLLLSSIQLKRLQMPIVDGLKSTKMLRSFEKTHPALVLPDCAAVIG